jgi:hypothetical protein
MIARGTLVLDAQIGVFHVELGDLLSQAGAGCRRMLHGVAQRRCGVNGGEHFAPRGLHVGLESLDLSLGVRIRGFLSRQGCGRVVALGDDA